MTCVECIVITPSHCSFVLHEVPLVSVSAALPKLRLLSEPLTHIDTPDPFLVSIHCSHVSFICRRRKGQPSAIKVVFSLWVY